MVVDRKYSMINFLTAGMFLTAVHVVFMAFSSTNPYFRQGIILSILLWIVSVFLWVSAVIALKKYGQPKTSKNYMHTTKMVSSGIYRFVKHPQYLSYILFNLGIMFKIQSGYSITIGMIAALFLAIGMKEEDKLLAKQFRTSSNADEESN